MPLQCLAMIEVGAPLHEQDPDGHGRQGCDATGTAGEAAVKKALPVRLTFFRALRATSPLDVVLPADLSPHRWALEAQCFLKSKLPDACTGRGVFAAPARFFDGLLRLEVDEEGLADVACELGDLAEALELTVVDHCAGEVSTPLAPFGLPAISAGLRALSAASLGYVVVEPPSPSPVYVQVLAERGRWIAEAVSEHHVPKGWPLSPGAGRRLQLMGWKPPDDIRRNFHRPVDPIARGLPELLMRSLEHGYQCDVDALRVRSCVLPPAAETSE